jgi:hypothetical protein
MDTVIRSRGTNPQSMKLGVAGLATTVLVSGGLGLAGLGLAAGAAQANPPGCGQYDACWCPGQRMPGNGNVVGDWDSTACHDYHFSDQDYPPGPHMGVEQGPAPRGPGMCWSMWIPSPCPAG